MAGEISRLVLPELLECLNVLSSGPVVRRWGSVGLFEALAWWERQKDSRELVHLALCWMINGAVSGVKRQSICSKGNVCLSHKIPICI